MGIRNQRSRKISGKNQGQLAEAVDSFAYLFPKVIQVCERTFNHEPANLDVYKSRPQDEASTRHYRLRNMAIRRNRRIPRKISDRNLKITYIDHVTNE